MPTVYSCRVHLASFRRELSGTKLGKCDSLHAYQELSILARYMRRQPDETRDPLTRATQTAKKVRPERGEARAPRLHERI